MLGDAYGAAVVAALSKKELMAMDEMNEKINEEEEDNTKKMGIHAKEQVGQGHIDLIQYLQLTDIMKPPHFTFSCHNPTNNPKQLKTTFVGLVL
jgi:hypothetical protein